MKFDLHSHSKYSPDSRVEPMELVKAAKRLGLDGIAITDHNEVMGVKSAQEWGREHGTIVIRGTEVSTEDGHVLAYGVTESLPRDQGSRETVDEIIAAGGVPVAAHPYRFWSGLGEGATVGSPFAAYEVQNARTLGRGNAKALALAVGRARPGIGGSDAHFLDEVGRAVSIIEDVSTEDEVIDALRRGRVRAEGINRGAPATVRYVSKCVSEWIFRGMRRM